MREAEEKCGIFGVFEEGIDAARVVYPGLFALQHRGQQASGIVSTDGDHFSIHKGLGLVAHVYDDADINKLTGFSAIGHNRYGTSGADVIDHAQPVARKKEKMVAVAMNGNLPSTALLTEFLSNHNVTYTGHNDTELMADAIRYYMKRGAKTEEAISDAYPLFTGAFSLLVLAKDKMVAVRDPKGIRPLSIGKLNGAHIFSSETCALDTVGADFIDDVHPGEMVVIETTGLKKYQLTKGQQKLDVFEFIYFGRPDSILLGKRIYEVRRKLGMELAHEQPTIADVVVGVPDSALPAALGYSQASGIPLGDGFIKNRYIHRTFIQPEQHLRDKAVMLKLNPLSEVVGGKRVVMIDDSIVRGTNAPPLVRMLRKAGAVEVHVRITSPPYLFPDFYGIDTPYQSKLIAAKMNLQAIRDHIGADSLGYLSLNGVIRSTGLPEDVFCTSQFTGIYPIDIRERAKEVSKIVFQY